MYRYNSLILKKHFSQQIIFYVCHYTVTFLRSHADGKYNEGDQYISMSSPLRNIENFLECLTNADKDGRVFIDNQGNDINQDNYSPSSSLGIIVFITFLTHLMDEQSQDFFFPNWTKYFQNDCCINFLLKVYCYTMESPAFVFAFYFILSKIKSSYPVIL